MSSKDGEDGVDGVHVVGGGCSPGAELGLVVMASESPPGGDAGGRLRNGATLTC